MARYKTYNYAQMKMAAVSYERQILPGTFEHTLNHLIDHDIDLVPFAARYVNDETGAPAYDPGILLKVILYAYSRGVTSSRDIAGLCRENIIFMALSADTDEGRYRYSQRLGTVEPVFADINHATGLRRFSLRGQRKVNAQWMMYCLAHNIGKIQRYGDIGRWKKERKAEIRQ